LPKKAIIEILLDFKTVQPAPESHAWPSSMTSLKTNIAKCLLFKFNY